MVDARLRRVRSAALAAIDAAGDVIGDGARDPAGVLAGFGYDIQGGVAGLGDALMGRAFRFNREEMRNGLRHPHIGLLMRRPNQADHTQQHGMRSCYALAAGLATALRHEYGEVTVVGLPADDDHQAERALLETGIVETFDAALGIAATTAGDGFFDTIAGSGATLASALVTVSFFADDAESARDALLAEVDRLNRERAPGESIEPRAVRAEDGGYALTFSLRAPSTLRVVALREQLSNAVTSAVEGRVVHTGTRSSRINCESIVSHILARRANSFAHELGLRLDNARKLPPTREPEWGNISWVTPTFVARFPISPNVDAGNANSDHDQALLAAKSMCLTAIDFLSDTNMRSFCDNQLVKALAERGVTRGYRRWTGVHAVQPKETTAGLSPEWTNLPPEGSTA
jgi:hypothetical protein